MLHYLEIILNCLGIIWLSILVFVGAYTIGKEGREAIAWLHAHIKFIYRLIKINKPKCTACLIKNNQLQRGDVVEPYLCKEHKKTSFTFVYHEWPQKDV